jgi:hypothetical protein
LADDGLVPTLACRCGYVHNLSPIPDDGFQVLPDWATDKLLYTRETKPEDWEIPELRRSALRRLYSCPNCEAVMWDRAGDGRFTTYLPDQRLIRIYADLTDRDALGGIRLGHPRTLADIQRQRLLLRPGVYVVAHDGVDDVYAHLELAVDETGDLIADVWVARPLAQDEVTQLREQGA